MRFSEKDKKILAHAEMAANLSISELGVRSGFKDHSVRYSLDRWKDLGLITHRSYVNLFKLGYGYYEIYFSLSAEGQKFEEEIVQSLIKAEQITWLAQIGGDYQYGLTFCAKSIYEASDYLDSFAKPYGKIFYERSFATRLSFSFFGNKYLAKNRSKNIEFTLSPSKEHIKIDNIDHCILKELTLNGDISKKKLAQELNLPLSTLELRRKKLEENGVLAGDYYYLKPAALTGLAFVILVSTRGISSELRDEFKECCRQHNNITTLINTLGVWDFEMAVEVENALEMHSLTGEIKNIFGPELYWIKVMPLFSFLKAALYPFKNFPPIN